MATTEGQGKTMSRAATQTEVTNILEAGGFTIAETKPDGTVVMDMPADWLAPAPLSALRAFQTERPRDLIDLFGGLLECATDINTAGTSVYHAHLLGIRPAPVAMASAKAAALRVIAAVDEYEGNKS